MLLTKIDTARVFRNIRVDPADAFKFGIKWQNKYYLNISAALGWVHRRAAFQLASDSISDTIRRGGHHVFAYMDDYILVSPADQTYSQFAELSALVTYLGFSMNPDKINPPTIIPTCLGILIDLDSNSLSIKQNKLDRIYAKCLQTSTKTYLSRKKFHCLFVKLLYLYNISEKKIKLSKEIFQDLTWFLPSFNGHC